MADPTRTIRILLLADSHLGFDHPVSPRIKRRRRGHDFLANYRRALRAAVHERVDLLVHGGDVFHKPRAPASLVYQAFDPLKQVADAGIPVFLVPGNHERSRIPFDWLARHPGIHVFEEPKTVRTTLAGAAVAVSGLPCIRRRVRTRFRDALRRTGWSDRAAGLRLLVAHQAFEGAVVGPSDFTFRRGHDVVRLADVPAPFAAVLAGHIHRSQVLEMDLKGRRCPAPVFYPGSLERTAFAERDEAKGFMLLEVAPCSAGGSVIRWSFRDLGARPMEIRTLRVGGLPADALEADGAPTRDAQVMLGAERLRSLVPASMNVDVVVPGMRRWKRHRREATPPEGEGPAPSSPPGSAPSEQRTLFQ